MASTTGGSFRTGRTPTFRSPTEPGDTQPAVGTPPAAPPNPGALSRGGRGFSAASFASAGDEGYRPGEAPPPAPEEDEEPIQPTTPLRFASAGDVGSTVAGVPSNPSPPNETLGGFLSNVADGISRMSPTGFVTGLLSDEAKGVPGGLAGQTKSTIDAITRGEVGPSYDGVTRDNRSSNAKEGERGWGDDMTGMPSSAPAGGASTAGGVSTGGFGAGPTSNADGSFGSPGLGGDPGNGAPGGAPGGGAPGGAPGGNGEAGGGVGGDTGVGNDGGNGGGGGDGGCGGGDAGGSGSGCFIAGTLILMADGSEKPIEDVVVGDRVKCFPEGEAVCASAGLVEGTVTDLMPAVERDDVITLNGVGVSPNHRFVTRDGSFTEAEFLGIGSNLVAGNGDHVLVTRSGMLGKALVYNFTVAPHHTYVAAGFRVHNHKRQGGYTGDDGDTRLEPRRITAHEREFVQRPEAVSKYGKDFMAELNAGRIDPAAARALMSKGGRNIGSETGKPGRPLSTSGPMVAKPVSRLGQVKAQSGKNGK